jgi:hypothetical protein
MLQVDILTLAYHTFYPPHHICTRADCVRTSKGLLLKKAQTRQIVLYTLDYGAVPAYAISLYCEGTQTTDVHACHP